MDQLVERFEPATLIAAGAAVLLAVLVVILLILVLRNRRRARASDLEGRFGAEYRRTIDASGSRRRAEEGLAERAERRQRYELRTLDGDERTEHRERWTAVQAGFVDGPHFTVQAGLELVRVVAVARGYPDGGLERILDDISVDHPELVADLRRTQPEGGRAGSTEHHREAFVHARALFERLVGEGETMDVRGTRPEAIHSSSRSAPSVESDGPTSEPADPASGSEPATSRTGEGSARSRPVSRSSAEATAPGATPPPEDAPPPPPEDAPPPEPSDRVDDRPLSATGDRDGQTG